MCYTEGQEFWWKNLIKMLCCIYVTHALSNLEAFLQQQRRDFIYVINNFFLQQRTGSTWHVSTPISHPICTNWNGLLHSILHFWGETNELKQAGSLSREHSSIPSSALPFPPRDPKSNCASHHWQSRTWWQPQISVHVVPGIYPGVWIH